MKLREFAGEILRKIYEYEFEQEQSGLGSKDIIIAVGGDKYRSKVNRALGYLKRKDLITGSTTLDGNWHNIKLTKEGIEVADNEDKYKRYFSISVGIPGIAKFEWGAKE